MVFPTHADAIDDDACEVNFSFFSIFQLVNVHFTVTYLKLWDSKK